MPVKCPAQTQILNLTKRTFHASTTHLRETSDNDPTKDIKDSMIIALQSSLTKHGIKITDDLAIVEGVLGTNISSTRTRRYNVLGKSAVRTVLSDHLFSHYKNMTEEHLSGSLALYSQRHFLVEIAREMNLHELFRSEKYKKSLDKLVDLDDSIPVSEELDDDFLQTLNEEASNVDSTLSQLTLRIIGAIADEEGLEKAFTFVKKRLLTKRMDISVLTEVFDPRYELDRLVSRGFIRDYAYQKLKYHSDVNKLAGNLTTVCYANNVEIGSAEAPTSDIGEMKASQDAINRYYSTYVKEKTCIEKEANREREEASYTTSNPV
ncbi:ribonuclease [Acrasis kona]|uniref:Ribonuclease n=1 Tax=Acrasis kona TaxID=1008807 RepID=A0AAW2Z898_9EUKA